MLPNNYILYISSFQSSSQRNLTPFQPDKSPVIAAAMAATEQRLVSMRIISISIPRTSVAELKRRCGRGTAAAAAAAE